MIGFITNLKIFTKKFTSFCKFLQIFYKRNHANEDRLASCLPGWMPFPLFLPYRVGKTFSTVLKW